VIKIGERNQIIADGPSMVFDCPDGGGEPCLLSTKSGAFDSAQVAPGGLKRVSCLMRKFAQHFGCISGRGLANPCHKLNRLSLMGLCLNLTISGWQQCSALALPPAECNFPLP
jgi:hypothetical protein